MDIFAKYGPTVNYHKLDQCFCQDCKGKFREILKAQNNLLKAEKDKVITDKFITENYKSLCSECTDHYHKSPHMFGGYMQTHILTIQEIDLVIYDNNYQDMLEILYSEKGDAAKTLITKVNLYKCTLFI